MPIQQIHSFLKQKNIRVEALLFPIYLIAALLMYGKGYRGELVDDGLAGLFKFKNMGWHGFWQSFGFTSLYYCHDFFVLTVYKIVGTSALGWFIVMVTLHSFNACLSYSCFNRFYAIMGVGKGMLISIAGSALFLLSPYQTENVLWAATLHYAIALTIFLTSFFIILNILHNGSMGIKTIFLLCVLQCIALLTLEISLVFPLAYMVVGIGIILSQKAKISLQQFIARLIIPFTCLIVLYFVITRIVKGHWIPHYGETHLLNNNIQTYATNYARYILKMVGYIHFTSYPTRNRVYDFCYHWQIVLAVEILMLAIIFFLMLARKKKAQASAFLILTALSFILLLPSLHMFFMSLFITENDRLNYFFSLAVYQVVAITLVTLLSYAGVTIIFIYGIIGLYFLHYQANNWYFAGVIQDNCIKSFIWADAPKVYVLNETTNFNGAYVFRNDERLLYALGLFKNYSHPERIVQVFSSCTSHPGDSTIIEIRNDSTLHVSLITGGWLMHEAVGATDYNTEDFDTRVDKWAPAYDVTFHHKQKGTVYIYLTPSGFKQLNNF